MCAICGVINKNHLPLSLDLLQTMTRTMRHRGPDQEGYQQLNNVGLGFQRLSIIDLVHGQQPMSNEDDSLWIVFNGEIYNFQQLRAELEASGRHHFKTQTDTEVILHLYEDLGEQCVERLRGMFAFAIWNDKTKTLFMARDRLGKKPLIYADLPNAFLFSSEIKALLKHPDVSKEIDYQAIDLYLSYQYIPSPHTIFKSIKKLPPAHTLTSKDGGLSIKRYWSPPRHVDTTLDFHEAQDAMMEKLKEATRIRMIADVPIGAFLSGGKDSSVIVGLMSELSSQPIKTFSIGFEEEAFSELPYAAEVAAYFKCDHHEFVVKSDMIEVLSKLVWHYGEPFADSSALPSYFVSKMSRQYVTVALNGDGGDETLAGYPRYKAAKLAGVLTAIPVSLRKTALHIFSLLPDGVPPHALIWRMKRLLGLGVDDPRTFYLDMLCFFKESQKQRIYSPFMKQQLGNQYAADHVNALIEPAAPLTGTNKYLYADLLSYLPECLMVKMDIASMANSLEARSPFLDHEFVELALSFPSEWKLRGLTQSKYILNQKIKGWLPSSVLNRKKQGFALPMSHWFKGPLRHYVSEMLLSEKAVARNVFKKNEIQNLLVEHQQGRSDHSYELWSLLVLEQWFQVYMDNHD